jgi:hypothetical protein
MVSPRYNQVITGKVNIEVANPINLTAHRFPNPIYPIFVAYQNNKLIGIPNKDIIHIDLVPLAQSQTSWELS